MSIIPEENKNKTTKKRGFGDIYILNIF
jgi:hypothetical protein